MESVGGKEKNITQSSYKGNYNSPTIIKYNSMISDIPNDEIFLHSEIKNNNSIFHNNELMKVNDVNISNELKIDNLLPEEQISYSSCLVICESLYNVIKNKSEISNYVIGLLLEISHVINNTTNKDIVLSRLLEQTKELIFVSNMKEISNI